jgi:hypothetical protein
MNGPGAESHLKKLSYTKFAIIVFSRSDIAKDDSRRSNRDSAKDWITSFGRS